MTTLDQAIEASFRSLSTPTVRKPNCSPKQLELIRSLRDEKQVPASWDHCFRAAEDGTATYEQIRLLIDALFKLPKKVAAFSSTSTALARGDVPAGRYAVDGADGETKFYVVDRPTEGRWGGFTFVKVQASDELYAVRGASARTVLAQIAIDPRGAMIRYGHELGVCGRCGRTLTDSQSRAAGIGPVCAAKGF